MAAPKDNNHDDVDQEENKQQQAKVKELNLRHSYALNLL